MRKQVKLIALLAVLSLIGVTSWRLLHAPDSEPIYEGKKLTLWLQAHPTHLQTLDELLFDEWMRSHEQTRFLIRALETKDSPLRRPYLWIRTNTPAFVAKKLPDWSDPRPVRESATYWLGQLGSTSKTALPALCAAARKDPSAQVRRGAIWALGHIDLEAENVRKVLLAALSADSDPGVRVGAAGSLEMSELPPAQEIILAFVHGLSDPDPLVRDVCAAALGKSRSRGTLGLEKLKRLANSNDEAADYAKNAVRQIEAAANTQAK